MKIKMFNFETLPIAVVDNFYSEESCNNIMQELLFLNSFPEKMLDASENGSAKLNGKILKQAKGVFLDSVYSRREFSSILKENRKLFDSNFLEELKSHNIFFDYLIKGNLDHTVVHYYENTDYYDFHTDNSIVTCITWFYKLPKKFSGGNLEFKNGLTIEPNYNRMIIFPSILEHAVSEVILDEKYTQNSFGRFSMSQFIRFQLK
jgi:Rps23 Pro-64 3,4-dihydroxylase Tpa1-like proline 4-hydroxylase